MATFIKGLSDQFGPMQLYKPDYQFLTQVYGTKQAEYDRGFSMVKNLYNSVLNGNLTNAGNQEYRQEAFKKLQTSLKSMANIDLSNPTNIMRAQSLVDPISKDKEIAYDMYVTNFHEKQKQMMDTYKNSQDPKMRALYSDYSKMDIQLAEDDLRSSKRGDGSILKVQPREFTPFEDVNEYLRKAAKEEGLEITTATPDGKGYIIKRTNGAGAVPIFNNWSKGVMGTKFDRQFAVMGRVNAEMAIRNEMSTKNISRQDAIQTLSQRLLQPVNTKEATAGVAAETQYKKLNDQISFYEKRFPNGFPPAKPEIAEEYQRLIKARDEYKADHENARNEVSKIQSEGPAYIAANLYSIYTKEAKDQTALQFAAAHATAKQSYEVRPDSTWATKANIASREKIAGAQLALQEKKLDWDKQKTSMRNQLKMLELKGKGYVPNETLVGTGVSDQPAMASDLLGQSFTENRDNAYRSAFNGENGLMKLVVDEDAGKFSRYYAAITKVKQMSNGQQVNLTEQDVANLNEYAGLLNIRIKAQPTNAASAHALLDGLMTNTYKAATDKLALHSQTYNTKKAREYQKSFAMAAGAFQNISGEHEKLVSDMKRINQEVLNTDGSIKDMYKGAVIKGSVQNGVYNIDLSNISPAAKQRLSSMVTSFKDRQNPVSYRYNFSKLSPAEIDALVKNPNIPISVAASDGSTIKMEALRNMNYNDLVSLFGDNSTVFYDAVKKQVRVELNVSQKDGIAKSLGLKNPQSLYVTIPYESIQSSAGALSRFAKNIPTNSVNLSSLGTLAPFMTNPHASIVGETTHYNTGFDYRVTGVDMSDGTQKLLFTYEFENPVTNKKEQGRPIYFDYTPGDPTSLQKAYAAISQEYNNYLLKREEYEALLDQ